MVNLLGRCFEVMTTSWGENPAILTMGEAVSNQRNIDKFIKESVKIHHAQPAHQMVRTIKMDQREEQGEERQEMNAGTIYTMTTIHHELRD